MVLALQACNKYSRIWKIDEVGDLEIEYLQCLTQIIPRLNHQLFFMNHKAELKSKTIWVDTQVLDDIKDSSWNRKGLSLMTLIILGAVL